MWMQVNFSFDRFSAVVDEFLRVNAADNSESNFANLPNLLIIDFASLQSFEYSCSLCLYSIDYVLMEHF